MIIILLLSLRLEVFSKDKKTILLHNHNQSESSDYCKSTLLCWSHSLIVGIKGKQLSGKKLEFLESLCITVGLDTTL